MPTDAGSAMMKLNVQGRVFCACRALGVSEPARIAIYAHAVEDAVVAASRSSAGAANLDAILTEQVVLLGGALANALARNSVIDRPPEVAANVPLSASAAIVKKDELGRRDSRLRRKPALPNKFPQVKARPNAGPKNMEEKLQESRKPIRKLVLEDCVALGLLTRDRAVAVGRSMAGKTPVDAEAQIVAELRNNLHSQVREYMRKHKGGPWPKPRAQEDLRLDITGTRSVNHVLLLARQILRERTKWEADKNRSMISSLLGGRLRFGLARRH